MGPVGWQEMVIIFIVALVLFGPKKLPELGRTVGKAISEFRRASSELKATFEQHMNELDRETQSLKEVTNTYSSEAYNHYDSQYHHDSGAYGTESHDYHAAPEQQQAALSSPTESYPSTASASAPQDAEVAVSTETPELVNGTVPRNQAGSSQHPVNS